MNAVPRTAAAAVLTLLAAAPLQAAEGGRQTVPEPQVQQTVIEDEGVRIEELRVRGQTQRIVVQPKGAGAAYEVLPAQGGRDISAGPASGRGAAGQRVWNLFAF